LLLVVVGCCWLLFLLFLTISSRGDELIVGWPTDFLPFLSLTYRFFLTR
jgi:hypothetical protein